MKRSEQAVEELRSPTKESVLASRTVLISPRTETERGDSSESSIIARDESSSEDGLINVETSKQSKELVPIHQLSARPAGYRINDTASTSYEDQSFSDAVSANVRSNMDVANGGDTMRNKNKSQVSAEVINSSSSSPHEIGVSHSCEVSVEISGSSSASVVSESLETSESQRDDTPGETTPPGLGFIVSGGEQDMRDGSVVHVDVVSISSSILSSSSNEDLMTDGFFDVSGDFFHDGVGGDSGNAGSRIHSMNERLRFWRELTVAVEGEESGTRASISRIVMLAEALFEGRESGVQLGVDGDGGQWWVAFSAGQGKGWVLMGRLVSELDECGGGKEREKWPCDWVLDEIHRQPGTLSLSVVSLPAPEAVVDSFPVRCHRKPDTTESADDDAQCYICLSEYEESDKIRVLPCRHEFHMMCVDKWLKEIHGVCPLCRGDVRVSIHTEAPISNSETSV
ncbi:RING/U-box superfamily protein [Actinidia rufa]|uniref:RING/U-box superfamily protein n=1 Tax=Actinidia rufa TaxID=165716 RepID=A0A7J0FLT6_9ERIC|nr:RING/U-box superfamily protein [Actinidia rufa]